MSALSSEALLNNRFHGMEQKGERIDSGIVDVEMPWHKIAARCCALGMSPTETAEFCECSARHIGNLLRTPWFQERVNEFQEKSGVSLMDMFKGAGLAAFQTIVELCTGDKVPAAVKLNAAKEITERILGKSTQVIDLKATTIADPVARAMALEGEVGRLRDELKILPLDTPEGCANGSTNSMSGACPSAGREAPEETPGISLLISALKAKPKVSGLSLDND